MKDLEVIHNYLETQASLCFSLLYNRYASKIYSKCISLLKDEAMAQDATQEIFMKIFLNLARFGEKAKFSTWVYSITYNYCIDALRKDQRHGAIFSDDLEKAPDEAAEEVSDAEMAEIKVSVLKQVMQQIPSGDRAILRMKYEEGMAIKEMAKVLGKTESAIKMKIKRAKAKAQRIRILVEKQRENV